MLFEGQGWTVKDVTAALGDLLLNWSRFEVALAEVLARHGRSDLLTAGLAARLDAWCSLDHLVVREPAVALQQIPAQALALRTARNDLVHGLISVWTPAGFDEICAIVNAGGHHNPGGVTLGYPVRLIQDMAQVAELLALAMPRPAPLRQTLDLPITPLREPTMPRRLRGG